MSETTIEFQEAEYTISGIVGLTVTKIVEIVKYLLSIGVAIIVGVILNSLEGLVRLEVAKMVGLL